LHGSAKKHQIPLETAPPCPAEEVGYWRVSTGRDQSPDMQIAALKKRGIPDDNIFGEIASGRKAKRPQLEQALKLMAGRPGWTLVVWKLDRLGRDTMELLRQSKEFEAEGQNLVSMTEMIDTRTAMGRAFFGMLAVFAQFESDTTKERTRAGMAQAKRNGSQVGAPSKFTLKQWETMEKLILSPRAHTLSLNAIAHRFRVSVALVNLRFPGWRGKTVAQRKAWRRQNPLPIKK
jgi:DNA invertase Pin-like site-specific DNA recombinase